MDPRLRGDDDPVEARAFAVTIELNKKKPSLATGLFTFTIRMVPMAAGLLRFNFGEIR
jgi:hypothetical protein